MNPPPGRHDDRVPGLDGLRGLAALAVLVFHAWLYTLPAPNVANATGVADFFLRELRLGLVLFFVLSGFILYRPWVRAALTGGAGPRVARYLRSRAARVLPGYYVALAGSIALLWALSGSPGVRLPPVEALPLFLVFGQNFSGRTVMTLDPPMWTLAIEVCFYLLLPALGWMALRLGRRRGVQLLVPLTLILAGTAWKLWVQARGLPLPYTKSLPAALPYFGVGMAAAVVQHGRHLTTARGRALAGCGTALVALHVGLRVLAGAGHLRLPAATLVGDLPAAVGCAALIAAVAGCTGGRLLGGRPLVALGTVSYGLYLWNVPLLVWARGHGLLPMHVLAATALILPTTLVVATLSWRLVERPVQAAARARGRSRVRSDPSHRGRLRRPSRIGSASSGCKFAIGHEATGDNTPAEPQGFVYSAQVRRCPTV